MVRPIVAHDWPERFPLFGIMRNSNFAALDRETEREPDDPADQGDDRDVLDLTAGQITAAAGDILAAHFDADRAKPDFGGFRPSEVAGKRADEKPDNHEYDQRVRSSPVHHDYAASAASFLPFSTASSMVPTM